MTTRSFLPSLALTLSLVAAQTAAQCGISVMSLGPGCTASGTPALSIDVAGDGSTVEFRIDSEHPNSMGELLVSPLPAGNSLFIYDCSIHVDLNLILASAVFQTNAQGSQTLMTTMSDLPQLAGATFAIQAALAFQGAPLNGLSATNALMASVQCTEGKSNEGCGVTFWKLESNFSSWPAQYSPTTQFSSVFENAFPGMTLLQVLQTTGTGLNALGRQTVAALLNAATIPGFSLTTAQVISMFNAAFPGSNYNALIETFLDLNLGDCPLGGPTSGDGCGVLFWKLEANFPHWPAQYSPTTQFSSVFENAFPGLTLLQVLQTTGSGLEALGRQTVAALLNAATISGFPLTTAQVISMFNAAFPGSNYNALIETFLDLNLGDCPFSGPTMGEGCGVLFWKLEANFPHWPAQYSPTTQFSSVFENAFPGLTLLQVLQTTGTGLEALGRQTVAALLNAATIPGFPLTTAQVISMFNAAFPGGNYGGLTKTFLDLNVGDCPFGGPTTGEGCGHGFWKQEQHFGSWPSQYSPNSQFSSVFENAFPGMTLLQVLQQGGGGLNALGREVVAALLNAATIQSFPLTTAQVISMFNAVFPGGDYEGLKDELEELNSGNCPF